MPAARITVLVDEPIATIRPALHGQFAEHLGACINDGLWVGEDSPIPNTAGVRNDVLAALRHLQIPVLRWPGGCYADDYHWEDGVGPREQRPRRVNLWWGSGNEIECNDFGTHEFLRLCRLLGTEPYLAGNVGSGSPAEMRNWMEYCNFGGDSTLARRRAADARAAGGSPEPFNVRLWGVGNENWGCGGNFDPEDYASHYKRFATYLPGFGTDPYLIACGPDGNKPEWTARFLAKFLSTPTHFNRRLHAIAAHYYCGTSGPSATEFNTDEWCELLDKAAQVESLITKQRAVIDGFDPDRKIDLILDEWGTWHYPTPGSTKLWQQNTLRDALAAAITLDAFHRHADKLVMANIAQVVNVLQAMILTRGEQMVLTPTYHVFDMYRNHKGGQSLRTEFAAPPVPYASAGHRRHLPGLLGSASLSRSGNAAGVLTLSVVNPHPTLPVEADLDLRGRRWQGQVQIQTLTHEDLAAHNTFDEPQTVRPDPSTVSPDTATSRHVFPPASVSVLHGTLTT